MTDLLQWLGQTPPAAFLRSPGMAYPLVSAAHIAAIGLIIGAIGTLDARLLGAFSKRPVAELGPPLARVAAIGVALAVLTGFLLFSVRPVAYAANDMLQLKLALIGLGVANALALRFTPWWRTALAGGAIHPVLRMQAAASLLIWLAALLAGRWIGFTM
ncbi:DUF2214 domain-containing protein [Glycocaulis profundi]|nr:DUF2214 domain-containing protein [Glycocaulis profundi]